MTDYPPPPPAPASAPPPPPVTASRARQQAHTNSAGELVMPVAFAGEQYDLNVSELVSLRVIGYFDEADQAGTAGDVVTGMAVLSRAIRACLPVAGQGRALIERAQAAENPSKYIVDFFAAASEQVRQPDPTGGSVTSGPTS